MIFSNLLLLFYLGIQISRTFQKTFLSIINSLASYQIQLEKQSKTQKFFIDSRFELIIVNNRNNFLQQFEDSEQIASGEARVSGLIGDNQNGYPIQLIQLKPSGKIQINQKAMEIISQCDLPVGFVSLVGKYRTGKSFLLNKLLYLSGRGFRVDPSTSACTQGIWMWSKPVYNDRLNNYLFFIDTQGSQSLTKNVENDTKIFVLATLISSFLMFNTVGSIDEKSINELNVVTKLSLNILTEQNVSTRENQEILYRFMPKFLWILRDFTLQLAIKDGKRLTPKQYLEDCLIDQNTLVRTNEDSRKIRRAIVTNFKDRDCITLVRPAKQQRDIQILDSLPEHALRKQFVQAVNQLRDKIMREAGAKTYEGTQLYGSSICRMIQSYIKSMNGSGFPTIKTAWEDISQNEGVTAYNNAIDTYNNLYRKFFNQDEPKGQEIHKMLITLRDQTLTQFQRNLSQPNQPYNIKLKQFLSEKQQAILEVNRQLNDCKNVQILKECASSLCRKLQANQYQGKPEQIAKDIQLVAKQYKIRAKGQNKGDILSQFLTNLNPIILEIQKRPKPQDNSKKQAEIKNNQYEQKIKIMEKKMKSLENQLASAVDEKNKIAKSKLAEQQIPTGKNEKKKKSTGCCGGSDCTIM